MHRALPRALATLVASALALSGLVAAAPAHAAQTTVGALIASLPLAPESSPTVYDRALFKHWVDADRDGCDTRREVLKKESLVAVTMGAAGCTIVAGKWFSWYDGQTITAPADLDIDHMVPLAEAWRSGAHGWTAAQREAFANDLGLEASLTAVSASSNRSKGDRDPAGWKPTRTAASCDYARDWALVKYRWNLTADSAEVSALTGMASGACASSSVTLPAKGSVPTAVKTGVARLAGSDRYSTAVAISKSAYPQGGARTVYVVTGTNFPDALGAGPAAAAAAGVVLPVSGTGIPAVVAQELKRLAPREIVVVGGSGVVSESVRKQLAGYADTVRRVSGTDRYATAGAVGTDRFGSGVAGVLIATGANYPDALAGSAVGAVAGKPILLVQKDSLPPATVKALTALKPRSIEVLGSTGVVSDRVLTALKGYTTGSVTRRAGADRYTTAAKISSGAYAKASTVYLATGTNYPDALAGGPAAGGVRAPLLLTQPTCMPKATLDEIKRLGAVRTVVLGGSGVVSDAAARGTVCSTAAPAPAPAPKPSGSPNVRVSTVLFDPPGDERKALNEEYVVLTNRGTTGANLKGWTLRDEKSHAYTFGTFTLGAGKSVTVHTGKGTNSSTRLYWGSGAPIWNNDGDTAYLKDAAGKHVHSCGWTSAAKVSVTC